MTLSLASANPLSLLAAAGLDSGLENTVLRVIFDVTCLIMCVAVHEFGHAYVADRMGDPLPRAQGRVTLNPLAHIDLLGTVFLPALMSLGVGVPLAWGKPVEWSGHARFLTRRYSMRTIRLLVSVAGPAMNLLLALLLSLVFVVLLRAFPATGERAAGLLLRLVLMNLGLMFFNLLPIPPLDGRSFLEFLPSSLAVVRDFLTKYGALIFLGLVMLGTGGGPSPLSVIMTPFRILMSAYVNFLITLAS